MDGKTVFITGAARGIGAEAARMLAAAGANVALVGLEPAELERLAQDIGTDRALPIECDVTDRDALDAAVAQTVERFGGIDVVFANAGIGSAGLIAHVDPDAYERVIEVNLLGVWRTVRACLPQIVERRGYVLVNASIAALVSAFPVMSSYSTAKAGAEAFANSLRVEMKQHGVDVGVAYFSWIGTEMVKGAAEEHATFALVRGTLKGPLGKTYPVSVAGKAVLRGVEKRKRVVVGPRWVRAMLPLRGLLTRPAELDLVKVMPEVERASEEELRERGAEAFRPVGAGGKADAQARSEPVS